jgi:predicted N-acetyltransferase YhbS
MPNLFSMKGSGLMDQIITRTMRDYELDEMLNAQEQCFGLSRQYLIRESSLFNSKDYFVPENVFVIENSGQIDSLVVLTDMRFQSLNSEFKIGGIGGVVTLPQARGQGRMSTLLNYAVDQMQQRNIPLSILWGDTGRYRNFGWEMAGSNMIFTLMGKSVKGITPVDSLKLEGYRAEKHLDSIISMHRKRTIRVERSKAQYGFLYGRNKLMVWHGSIDSKSAYAVLTGNSVIEFGGDYDVLLHMLKQLLCDYAFSDLRLYCSHEDADLIRCLYAVSSIWHTEPLGMLKIIDLKELLRCCVKQIKKNLQDNPELHGECISLEMTTSRQEVTLSLGEKIEISEGINSEQIISLSDLEMVRLLFPFTELSVNGLAAKFSPVFKIPFFWNQLDMV